MATVELNTGQLFTIGGATGQAGPRQWVCDTMDEVVSLCRSVSQQPFPTQVGMNGTGFEDCWPVSAIVAPFNAQMAPGSTGSSVSVLPTYTQYRVTVHYQLLHDVGTSQSETWPLGITKPQHPAGSVLSLRIRNSGQFITISSRSGHYVDDQGNNKGYLNPNVSASVKIPIKEFHITLDRLKSTQVPSTDSIAGCVNSDIFLGCPKETLLWESDHTDPSFTMDVDDPRRWRCTMLLRKRAIPLGTSASSGFAGWNHEMYNDGNWYRVVLANGKSRYEAVSFGSIFSQ